MLLNPIRADRGAGRYARCVWHLGAPTRGAKAPRMERADDVVALDPPAVPEVGAQVGAVRIEQGRLAVLAPEQNVILSEVAKRLHSAGLEIGAPADEIPAVGEARRGRAVARERFLHERSIGLLPPVESLRLTI